MTDQPSPSEAGRKHLNPSELGTKEYWDALYQRELQNHAEDDQDEGTIWFEESNAEETILRELDGLANEGLLSKHTASFLDLGTGNGHMLFALRSPSCESDNEDDEGRTEGKGWKGDMVGVDYSAASIDLAKRIAAQRHDADLVSNTAKLDFETWDLLTQSPGPWQPSSRGFDVVLDKGTFDAISLMPSAGPQHPCATYHENVVPLLRHEGFLVVTSCNWTRDELVGWLVPDDWDVKGLQLFREAKYPSFTFGGQTGQSVVTLIFRRRKKGAATVSVGQR